MENSNKMQATCCWFTIYERVGRETEVDVVLIKCVPDSGNQTQVGICQTEIMDHKGWL